MIKKKKHKIKKVVLSMFLFLVLLSIVFALIIYSKVDKQVDVELFKTENTSITRIFYYEYDNNGKRIEGPKELTEEEIFLKRSEWTSIYEMPENLKNAFIAIEDKRFYDHKGVDWLRTGKAMLNYLFKFDKSGYGGSTITQQLIKNVTGENEITPKRKIEEIFRAKNIEKNLSKNEILESYLNVVYMGNNCYGVTAASQMYFNKTVESLTVAECATLASIVQNPSRYEPYRNPQNNKSRRNVVLKEMLMQGFINENEYNLAINEIVDISSNVNDRKSSGVYSWFTELLISDVAKDLAIKNNLNPGAARNLILKGGFNIYSTLNLDIQKQLEKIYENYVAYFDNDSGTYPESSCVIIDPYSSNVLALVGGTGKKKGNLIYNRATDAKRPLGSVIKPLSVYSVGVEENIFNYSTVYDDTPIMYKNGEYWPKNSPNRYRGLVPVYYALEHSINTVAVKALRDIGMHTSKNYLKSYGLRLSDGDNNESSLALGQLINGESLLNVTNAYTSFVNGGNIMSPKSYFKVTDSKNNVILEPKRENKNVISKETAYITTRMLCNVIKSGTGANIRLKEYIETAGKTGTSSNNEDKWFIGYTPYYVCGVWTGYDTPKSMNYRTNPSSIIFDEIMMYAHKNLDLNAKFDIPDTVIEQEFCFDSGELVKDECLKDERGDRTVIGYYKIETVPNDKCHIHKETLVKENNRGFLFDLFYKKKKRTLLDYQREEFNDIKIEDEEYLIKSKKREA